MSQKKDGSLSKKNKRSSDQSRERSDDEKQRERNLTDDGVSDQFFRCLWMKDELNLGLFINIPETIVFRFGQAVEWYFTNHHGKVKKKNKQNLLNARIEEIFNQDVLGYDVIAVFYSYSPVIDSETNQFGPTEVHYFNRSQLNDFLYKGTREINGVLQNFIEPKGTRNEMIRAVWSPKICLIERAENIHELHDERYGMYERCVTYEGPEYYYSLAPLRGPVLAGQIQAICENIASHLSAISFGEQVLSRMTLNFKVDSRDKIWLLYSSSIRVVEMGLQKSGSDADKQADPQLLNLDSVVQLPSSINLSPKKCYSTVVPKKRIVCLSCTRESLEDLRYPVTYKSIIKHYEHVLHLSIKINGFAYKTKIINWPPEKEIIETAGGVGFAILNLNNEGGYQEGKYKLDMSQPLDANELRIPPIIRHIHPKLNAKNYASCHKDPLFIYKTVNVCESCYLVYAEFSTMLLKLGQDLNKLLEPDQKAVDDLKSYAESVKSESGSAARPSSSDWRSMSSVKNSTNGLPPSPIHFKASNNHARAKEVAVGLVRSGDERRGKPPDLPPRVQRSGDSSMLSSPISGGDIHGSNSDLFSPIKTPKVMSKLAQSEAMGGGSPLSDKLYYEESVQRMIQDREQHFFKEITRNPNLKDQHPLMHLITAQQKLKLADESGGVSATKAAMKEEHVFGTTYGKQSNDKYSKYGVYTEEIPYIISGKVVLPSVLQKQKEELREKQMAKIKERKARRKARKESQTLDTSSSIGEEPLNEEQKQLEMFANSSKEHRAYLQEALTFVENDVAEFGTRDFSPLKRQGLSKSSSSPGPVISSPSYASQGNRKEVNFRQNTNDPSSRGAGPDEDLGFSRPSTTAIDRPSTTAQGARPGLRSGPGKISPPKRGGV